MIQAQLWLIFSALLAILAELYKDDKKLNFFANLGCIYSAILGLISLFKG